MRNQVWSCQTQPAAGKTHCAHKGGSPFPSQRNLSTWLVVQAQSILTGLNTSRLREGSALTTVHVY